MLRRWILLALIPAGALEVWSARGAEPAAEFGFVGKEVFPIDPLISQLKSADINGDGKMDLVLINNARSKINLLLNQTGTTNQRPKIEARAKINELPPDARFQIDSIASEKRISSLLVADLNNDQKPDLAYYGEPRELIVQLNQGTNGWSALKRFPIEDGTLDPYALTTGDLNGDKLPDVALLAEEHVYLLAQQKDGSLGEPEKIPYVGSVKSIQIMDVQGDGLEDLMLINWDNPNPFRVRLQGAGGQLRPEMHFALPPIRSYWADDLDGDKRAEIITIAQKSGRAQLLAFSKSKGPQLIGNWVQGQFEILPLTRTKKARRGVVWSDLNGDKRPDLLVAEPDSGQLAVYLQNASGSLDAPRTFSTLTGVTEMSVYDWDADGRAEVFLLSADERQVGVTTLDAKEKLAFPRTLPLEGRPLAIAAGIIIPGSEPSLAVILDQDGKRELQLRNASGEVKRQKLSETFKANPTGLTIHDVNQDGRPDLVVLIPYEKLKILVQGSEGEFQEVDLAPPGGSADQPWLSAADVDGDGKSELLLAQRNFIRAVVLRSAAAAGAPAEAEKADSASADKSPAEGASASRGGAWSFEVREQINGAASNSRIVGAAALRQESGQAPALFLLDADRKALTVSQRDKSGAWRVVKNVPLPFTEFSEVAAISLGSEGPNAVSLIGLNTVAWLSLSGEAWQLAEVDGYETPIKDGFLHDLVSGDLNNDGQKDLVFLETGKSHIDIVTYRKPDGLVPANRWQVFEERTFRSRRNDNAEPREALVDDFTGDGKNDLVVLVHDRVILYPQE